MKLKIEFDTDNDAFFEASYIEIKRILSTIGSQVEQGPPANNGGTIRDINGNTIGAWSWE